MRCKIGTIIIFGTFERFELSPSQNTKLITNRIAATIELDNNIP